MYLVRFSLLLMTTCEIRAECDKIYFFQVQRTFLLLNRYDVSFQYSFIQCGY